MASEDTIQRFLTVASEARLQMIRQPAAATELRDYLGTEVFGEYEALAERTGGAHLGGGPPNLIFVPGVMGSLLLSESLGGVWWIDARTRQHIDDLRLSHDGLKDANPAHRIAPCSTDPSYEAFLAAVIEQDAFSHVGFPYDWRKPLSASAPALRDRVVKLYEANGGEPVHLVAHSMGGLVVRSTLARFGDELWDKIGRIVFLATPHYGSQAIGGYLKNHLWGFDMMALLGVFLSRETYRSLWGVLNLLPAPRGIYPGTRASDPQPWQSGDPNDPYPHPCCNFDLYQAKAWELGLGPEQTARLQAVLDGAAAFHRDLYQAHRDLPQDLRDRMLMIAGVGKECLFRLANQERFFGLWEHMDKVTRRRPGDPHRDGDGRVPVASAALEDVTIRYVRGVHAGVPNIPSVYQDVFRWLAGKRLDLPDTPEGALAQHLGAADDSVSPHLDGTVRRGAEEDDPGYWEADPPTGEDLQDLEVRLDRGELPEFVTTRMF
ncbi:MAG TPA: alpha/beta fold hydrolase [Thermoanaerobaculia bacterium]|nr:alpha/beta fold hydrolase [Thermoanaerobaculia bacterium]